VKRLDGIDTLRGLSILAVVLLHIALRMRFAGHSLEDQWPPWLYHLMFWNGNNGVTAFCRVRVLDYADFDAAVWGRWGIYSCGDFTGCGLRGLAPCCCWC